MLFVMTILREEGMICRIMSHDSRSTRKIARSNVDMALDLVIKRNVEKGRSGNAERVSNDCKLTHKRFRSDRMIETSVVGFSKSLVLLEMRSYISRQDWKHALRLFPRLLEYPVELEPLIWRYAFIILLHTNDPSHLCRFFERCIGNLNSSNSALLKKLLSLPLKDRPSF
ncbi:uncharacterized protein LOC105422400 isoform X2 [Pogonomyrmex barbatus]|uniref:Uncharacterized protein LOC105422400 isoform X2 n=1 Tax=Pogonomyrmex barbatus TaxID=144034 RepID=A0A6I9VTN8_9HYME|nr:uncharacterized protein LOC105422400 isoform X2 [Pogonomyrmex barbatus]